MFDDPEQFDVRRDPNPHVGFGGPGPHFCLGAHLARREVDIVFRQLFARLPDIEVSGTEIPLQSAGLPLVAGVFMIVHFWRIRKDGSISGPAPVMLESEVKNAKGRR